MKTTRCVIHKVRPLCHLWQAAMLAGSLALVACKPLPPAMDLAPHDQSLMLDADRADQQSPVSDAMVEPCTPCSWTPPYGSCVPSACQKRGSLFCCARP